MHCTRIPAQFNGVLRSECVTLCVPVQVNWRCVRLVSHRVRHTVVPTQSQWALRQLCFTRTNDTLGVPAQSMGDEFILVSGLTTVRYI